MGCRDHGGFTPSSQLFFLPLVSFSDFFHYIPSPQFSTLHIVLFENALTQPLRIMSVTPYSLPPLPYAYDVRSFAVS